MQQSVLFHAKPVYIELPVWKDVDISNCHNYDDLPESARKYVECIEELSGVPASIIGVGPDRKQTIIRGWESK